MSKLYVIILFVFTATVFSQNADTLNKRGLSNFDRGDYAAAIEDFSRVIDLTSRLDHRSESRHPDLNSRKSPFDEESKQVTVVDSRTAVAYVNRGKTYFAEGNI